MRRIVTAGLAWGAAFALACLPTAAHATRNFPTDINNALGTPGEPSCAVCHAGGAIGRGTVTTPFGIAMRARGMVAGDDTSVTRALDALRADNVDSDGDMVTDIDELVMGSDPNVPAGTNPPPPIVYGCAQVAPGRGAPLAIVLGGAIAAFAVVVARRSKRARPRARTSRR